MKNRLIAVALTVVMLFTAVFAGISASADSYSFIAPQIGGQVRASSSGSWIDALNEDASKGEEQCVKFPSETTAVSGGQMRFVLPNIAAGSYRLTLVTRDKSDRSSFQTYVNGSSLGAVVNTTQNTGLTTHIIGVFELSSSGDCEIMMQIITRKLAAFYIRSITLTPSDEPIETTVAPVPTTTVQATGSTPVDGSREFIASQCTPQNRTYSYNSWSSTALDSTGYVKFSCALDTGATMRFTLPEVAAGEYTLTIKTRDKNDRSRFQTIVNGAKLGAVVDTKSINGEAQHEIGRFTQATAGSCDIQLTIPTFGDLGNAGFYIWSLTLSTGSAPINPITATGATPTQGGAGTPTTYYTTQLSPMMKMSDSSAWEAAEIDTEENCPQFVIATVQLGSKLRYTIPALAAGEYSMSVSSRDKKGRSKYTMSVNGETVGSEVDATIPASSSYITHDIGSFTQSSSGACEIIATVTTRAEAGIYIRTITLTPLGVTQPQSTTAAREPDLLYKIACVSDVHVDRDCKDKFPEGLKPGFINMCNSLALEGCDSFLLGGDLVSNNEEDELWTESVYNRTIDTIYKYAQKVSKNVLFASGNHDYSPGAVYPIGFSSQFTPFVSGNYRKWIVAANGSMGSFLAQRNKDDFPLAYRYSLSGLDYFVLNTPYVAGDIDEGGYVYSDAEIEWLDQQLATVQTGKTVVVMGHYPLQNSNGVTASTKCVSELSSRKLKAVLIKYNAIYVYGHDHGGGSHIASDSFERITPYTLYGEEITQRVSSVDGIISSFMGSGNYYGNIYNPDTASTTDNNAIFQAMIISIYQDKVTFQMKNYGDEPKNSYQLDAYTVSRSFVRTVAPTTASRIMYGDANGDKVVNAKDLLMLRQHLAEWKVNIDLAAADCNADSAVNAKDVLILRQYFAGWKVLLGK